MFGLVSSTQRAKSAYHTSGERSVVILIALQYANSHRRLYNDAYVQSADGMIPYCKQKDVLAFKLVSCTDFEIDPNMDEDRLNRHELAIVL